MEDSECVSRAFFHGLFVLGDDQHSGFTQYSKFSPSPITEQQNRNAASTLRPATRPKIHAVMVTGGIPFVAVAASLGQLKALMQIAKLKPARAPGLLA